MDGVGTKRPGEPLPEGANKRARLEGSEGTAPSSALQDAIARARAAAAAAAAAAATGAHSAATGGGVGTGFSAGLAMTAAEAQRAAIARAQQLAASISHAAPAAAVSGPAGFAAAHGRRVDARGLPAGFGAGGGAAASGPSSSALPAGMLDAPTAASAGGLAAGARKSGFAAPPLVLDARGRPTEDGAAAGSRIDAATAASLVSGGTALPRVTSLKINAASRVAPAAGSSLIPESVIRARPGERPSRPREAPISEAAKANPYLAHHRREAQAAPAPAAAGGKPGAAGDDAAAALPSGDASAAAPAAAAPRKPAAPAAALAPADAKRLQRARRGLSFVEHGRFAQAGEAMRQRAAAAAAAKAGFHAGVQGARGAPNVHPEWEAAGAARSGSAAPAGEGGSGSPLEPWEAAEAALAASVPPKHRIVPIAPAGAHYASTAEASAAAAVGVAGQPMDLEWWDAALLPPARTREYVARAAEPLRGAQRAHAAASSAAPASAASSASMAVDGGAAPSPAPAWQPGYTYDECSLRHARTWNLVQHPVPVITAADREALAPRPLPLMLTKQERRKQRRLTRAARFQEVQDQVRIGLLPPPEPKVRLANLMRVLKDAAVADPSALEAKVRAQVAQRVRNHEARNLARKLTPQERRDKWRRKMRSHGPAGPEAALLRVSDLSHGKTRYKVDVAAREALLGGLVLECASAGCALVYVEGGTRAVRKYVRLLSSRVNWNRSARKGRGAGAGEEDEDEEEDDEGEEEEEEDEEGNVGEAAMLGLAAAGLTRNGFGSGPGSRCELVWRGVAPRLYFTQRQAGGGGGGAEGEGVEGGGDGEGASVAADIEAEPLFSWEEVRSEAAARRVLEARGLPHLWDAVLASARSAAAGGAVDGSGAGEAAAHVRAASASDAGDSSSGLVGEALLAHIRARFSTSGFLGPASAAAAATGAGAAGLRPVHAHTAGAFAAAGGGLAEQRGVDESDESSSSSDGSEEEEEEDEQMSAHPQQPRGTSTEGEVIVRGST